MAEFKDKYAQVGRVRPQQSKLTLPINEDKRSLSFRFTFKNDKFYIGSKRIKKEDAINLAKWILSHE